MPDNIAHFPFLGPDSERVGIALAKCYAEFQKLFISAQFMEDFVQDAETAGVREQMAERVRGVMGVRLSDMFAAASPEEYAEMTRRRTEELRTTGASIVNNLIERQFANASKNAKLSLIVVIHNALDVFFWRLIRFGLIVDRDRAVEEVKTQRVEISKLVAIGQDAAIDESLEKWWEEKEKRSLLEKWDRAVALLGFPAKLNEEDIKFSKQSLVDFDRLRHDVVHRDPATLAEYDLAAFTRAAARGVLVWTIFASHVLEVELPDEHLLGFG